MWPSPEQVLDWSGPREGGGSNRINRYKTQLFSELVSSWIHTLELPQQAEMGQEAREGILRGVRCDHSWAGRSTNWTLDVAEQEERRKGREPSE